jgi:hypothetical protein
MKGNSSTSTTIGIKIAGASAILFGVGAGIVALTMNPGAHGIVNPRLGLWHAALIVVIGIGTLLLRRWAALLLALGCSGVAVWLVLGSIVSVPFPWCLINFAAAGVLFAPAAFTFKSWRQLR